MSQALNPWRRAGAIATALFAVGVATAPSVSLAMPEAQVSEKLDTILMLMAVDGNGAPLAVKANIDGKFKEAYLAAISIAAAEEIAAGKRYGLDAATAKGLRFAPVSLARFIVIVSPLVQATPTRVGVIAPDPAQQNTAASLLMAQQVPAEQARQLASLQPMIFCPFPDFMVSTNSGPEKGKQFVPCATESDFVQEIISRAVKSSPQIAAIMPRVVAIPLKGFIAFLRNQPEARAAQFRVVPSGRMVSLIQQISRQQQPGATTTPAATPDSQSVKPASQSAKPAIKPAAKPSTKASGQASAKPPGSNTAP